MTWFVSVGVTADAHQMLDFAPSRDHMQAKEKPEFIFTCIGKHLTRTGILNNGYSHLVASEGPGGDTACCDTGSVCGFYKVMKGAGAAPQGAVTLRLDAQQCRGLSQAGCLAGIPAGILAGGQRPRSPCTGAQVRRRAGLGQGLHGPLLPDQWL